MKCRIELLTLSVYFRTSVRVALASEALKPFEVDRPQVSTL